MDSKISEIISNYCKTKPVLRAWVFGSFSRGEEREDSDIDILVQELSVQDWQYCCFSFVYGLQRQS